MKRISLSIKTLTAFGTRPKGDTLFGQLCWAIRNRFGVERLNELLQGYSSGKPFMVISDFMPSGLLPKPAMPLHRFNKVPSADAKSLKRIDWISVSLAERPVQEWLLAVVSDGGQEQKNATGSWHTQPHNSINRQTGGTGTGMFAPYNSDQLWFGDDAEFNCHAVIDDTRFSEEDLLQCFEDVGLNGFGRDASIGLGKFECRIISSPLPVRQDADAWLTLAPSSPQGMGYDAELSWYRLFTRFGRHGDRAALSGKPFKSPLMLADTGALFSGITASEGTPLFLGQGLGGDGSLSAEISSTVHQGYAPVVGVILNSDQEKAA